MDNSKKQNARFLGKVRSSIVEIKTANSSQITYFLGTEVGIEDIETDEAYRLRRMEEEGITEQDIADTMPDNPFQ